MMVGAQLEGFDRMVHLDESNEWAVIEGDEYLSSPIDRKPKFLWYAPHVTVLTGIAWDHINVFRRKKRTSNSSRGISSRFNLKGQWCIVKKTLSWLDLYKKSRLSAMTSGG